MIDADNLVVGATSQPAAIGAKPDRMNCSTVVAHMAQLFRARVLRIGRIANGLHAPDAHMAIARRGRETASIGRDVAGVDLEVLLLAWTSVSIHGALVLGASGKALEGGDVPLCVSQAGRMKCMIARLVWDWHGTLW